MCVLVLGILVPAAAAEYRQKINTDSRPLMNLAMVMGRLTNVHKIGKIIIAHAVRLHYFGIGTDHDVDMGVIRDRNIMFRDGPGRFRMFSMGQRTMVFGDVLRLRIIL